MISDEDDDQMYNAYLSLRNIVKSSRGENISRQDTQKKYKTQAHSPQVCDKSITVYGRPNVLVVEHEDLATQKVQDVLSEREEYPTQEFDQMKKEYNKERRVILSNKNQNQDSEL